MNEFNYIGKRRRSGGCSVYELSKNDKEWAICFPCRKKHQLRGNNAAQDYLDFAERHKYEQGCVTLRVNQEYLYRIVQREEKRRKHLGLSSNKFTHNASVLEAFQTNQTLDLTGIGIASSTTAGWCSNWIDNSSNLYLDILFWYYSQAVNTVASGQKSHFLFAPGSFDSTDLPTNTAGNTATNSASTSATLTFLDVTANDSGWSLVKMVPYITTNKALQSGLFGIAKAHDGVVPLFIWLALINNAGPTIGTGGSPATIIKYRGTYCTVA